MKKKKSILDNLPKGGFPKGMIVSLAGPCIPKTSFGLTLIRQNKTLIIDTERKENEKSNLSSVS